MTANIDIFSHNNKLNAEKNTKESKNMSILLNNPYSNGIRIEPGLKLVPGIAFGVLILILMEYG